MTSLSCMYVCMLRSLSTLPFYNFHILILILILISFLLFSVFYIYLVLFSKGVYLCNMYKSPVAVFDGN